MTKQIKIGALLLLTLSLCGCVFPFQSKKYPTWSTKGILESYTLSDGRVIDGWSAYQIGDKITAKWYNFTVNSFEKVNEYGGYKKTDKTNLYHANISITNTSDKKVYLFDGDFALLWNLDKTERSYAYSKEAKTDTMLKNEIVIDINETKTIDTLYEVDNNVSKPMAIYYYEQYSDGTKGNKYYVYIN